MKKKITTIFLTTAIALGFAQEATFEQTLNANAFSQPKSAFPLESESSRKGTFYVKLGASDAQLPENAEKVLPAFGLGYRAAFGASAIDMSVNGSANNVSLADKYTAENYTYDATANYLYYISPAKNNSFYAGAGLGLGGMKDTTVVAATDVAPATSEVTEFHGIIPNVVAGYEMGRNSSVRTFFQIDVSQPALAISKAGKFPTPIAEFSVGAGF